MPDVTHPRRGEPVDSPCSFCDRQPIPGETYGPAPDQWDFAGICPKCWDDATEEEE